MTIRQYRKRPVVIKAMEITNENVAEVAAWCNGRARVLTVSRTSRWVEIDTLEGTMTGEVGDFIIQGVQGEFYPCKPAIFAETYEEV